MGHVSRNWDHPRACGEQIKSKTARINWMGSSPRMRGAGVAARVVERDARIIPAHAGSSAP